MTEKRKTLMVVTSDGSRQRFLRGMITYRLVQHGLGFDEAYALANAIRDRLSDRTEVQASEIRDLIEQELERARPGRPTPTSPETAPATPDLWVVYHGHRQPFSRGLLARSIHAAGVEFERAYRLVTDLRASLLEEGVSVLPSTEIARRVAELLSRFEGPETAQRYRMVRRLNRMPRPIVIYLAGASGTGKSSLSLELAPLLRIFRINATDTIRQVMRMVFSPAVLPALHVSSFEPVPDTPWDEGVALRGEEFGHRLIASYEEQAIRVNVGVRAVVERAIAENMSILVEGVHLLPPLIPFVDLEGSAYQVPIMLASLDAEEHRSRFLARARATGRRAERYLENFESIRLIHDFLLERAETHDVPLLDTGYGEPPVDQAIRLLGELLARQIPSAPQTTATDSGGAVPTLLVIIDGLADRPTRALGGRTPLQAAKIPTLDRLAREGQCGLADPVAPGVVPDTAAGSLALFGQSPLAMKRGPIEALGTGLELRQGDIALRGNFATLDGAGHVIDRRAGRIREDGDVLALALDRPLLPEDVADGAEILVRRATEHRLAIVLRGHGLSSAIQGSDPGDAAVPGLPLTPKPVDPKDERAVRTARLLAYFEQHARTVLGAHKVNKRRVKKGLPPANSVLTRGTGHVHRLLPLEDAGIPLRLTAIGGDSTVLGLARWLGAEVISTPEMTANLDTDIGLKFETARDSLRHNDLVMVHLKGADIAAHDQRPELKAEFLERIDAALAELLETWSGPLRIAVASDHATLSESGQHAADPLPVLVWGSGIEADSVTAFDEQSVASGALQRFPLQMLLGRVFDLH